MDLPGKLRLLPKLSANHNGKESVIALALYPKGTAAGGKKMKNTNSKLSVLIQLALLTSVILLHSFVEHEVLGEYTWSQKSPGGSSRGPVG